MKQNNAILRPSTLAAFTVAALASIGLATSTAHAGRVIGSTDDDDNVSDAGPANSSAPPAGKDAKDPKAKDAKDPKAKDAKDAKSKDAKPADTKPTDAKDAKAKDAKPVDAKDAKPADAKDAKAKAVDAKDAKPADAKDAKDAKAVKSGKDKVVPKDVLEDTAAEKAAKAKADEAKAKAEQAADDASKKKEEEQRKLLEEKKAADAKKKLENRDQRLAAAKKIRTMTRTSGSMVIGLAVEPGYVVSNGVVEVRAQVAEKVDVPDPRYGDRVPQKGVDLTATVTGNGKKLRYEMHALDAPGRYGFHTTPLKDGTYTVQIDGTTKDHKPVSASFPLHVGAWPPPDFDSEEENNLKNESGKAGRNVVGEN